MRLFTGLGLTLVLAWLYVGDLVLWVRASSAPVTVFGELPSLPLAVIGALAGLGVLVTTVGPVAPRARALAWAVGVSSIVIDLTFVSSRRSAQAPEMALREALDSFAEQVASKTSGDGVMRDVRWLKEALPKDRVPLLVEGQRVAQWRVVLKEQCQSPETTRTDEPAGTFIYCVSSDGRRAWITVVGTKDAVRFGPPAVVSVGEGWVAQVVISERRRRR